VGLGTGEVRRSTAGFLALACLVRPRLGAALARCLVTILRFFFLSQNTAHLEPRGIPLVEVDHPLDAKVPFMPESAGVYLGFIRDWIAALSHALRALGIAEAERAAVAFLDGLGSCYREAYRVYRRRVSTTARPRKAANARLGLIYLLDPHLYCVPSLHVMVVCHAFLGYEAMFESLGKGAESAVGREELLRRAVAITDSVLYVKQHSVNCIPAALFATSCMRPEFGRSEARAFIGELLDGLDSADDRAAIRSHIASTYEGLMDEEARMGHGCARVIMGFLDGYAKR